MEWQPIETAPRDGTSIKMRGRYRALSDGPLIEVDGRYDSGGYTEGWETDRGAHFNPTHWMPLPDPPNPR